jgi:hypothetical protein
MAKHRGSRRYRHRRGVKRGGNGNYTSASSYGSYVNGSGNSQFARTFDQTGPYANRFGTDYVGAQGQWANAPHQPTQQDLSLIQSAGRTRRKRGGLLGEVVNQAIVPFGLLALQQSYRRDKRGGKHTRKHTRKYRR